jgi:hypothetical protein
MRVASGAAIARFKRLREIVALDIPCQLRRLERLPGRVRRGG